MFSAHPVALNGPVTQWAKALSLVLLSWSLYSVQQLEWA